MNRISTKGIGILVLLGLVLSLQVSALNGNPSAHDPSTIIKEGDTYWVYATSFPWSKSAKGNGVYTLYSKDLINWTPGKRIFDGAWPKWINTYVPSFAGNFWAPEIIHMNGKYFMYYACSVYGAQTACLGVASSPTLDQNSPDYKWTDLGMVAKSAVTSDVNAIDPAAFLDATGRAYLTYGSYSAGIGIIELNAVTGLLLQGAKVKVVAGGGHKDWEAPCLLKIDSYYYLFVNRGGCCNGTNSSYYIVVGRSANPTGPFLDKTGKDLVAGTGTTVLSRSGKYIGPGHFGLLRENGVNYVSYHYYYGPNFGDAYLDIATMKMVSGWPIITRDWLPEGSYSIQNQSSTLAWEVSDCKSTAGAAIMQNTLKNTDCQKWNFKALGDGYYTISSALSGSLVADVNECSTRNGAKLQIYNSLSTDCQKFKIEKAANGSFVLTPAYTNKVLEVPSDSKITGTPLALFEYNGCNCQKWIISPFGTVITSLNEQQQVLSMDPVCYPNPFKEKISLQVAGSFIYTLTDLSGTLVETGKGENDLSTGQNLKEGFYLLGIETSEFKRTYKILKNQ